VVGFLKLSRSAISPLLYHSPASRSTSFSRSAPAGPAWRAMREPRSWMEVALVRL
jgi:hypothetical protein